MMGEYSPLPNIGQHLLAEARTQYFSEADPVVRAQMMAAAISEGDLDIDGDLLYAAYAEIGEEDATDPKMDSSLELKKFSGHLLVKALSGKGNYEAAYQIATDLGRLAEYDGLLAKCALLESGYAGPDGELLHLYTEEHLSEFTVDSDQLAERFMCVERFLTALTAHGINVAEHNGPYERLVTALDSIAYTPWRQPHRFSNFAVAAIEYGKNSPLALQFAGKIPYHTLRTETFSKIGRYIDDLDTIKQIIPELDATFAQTVNCYGRCGYRSCNPGRDAEVTALETAGMLARVGETMRARKILSEFDDGYHPVITIKAYAELYEAEGREADRRAVLHLLNEVTARSHRNILPGFIKQVAQADMKFGRMLPGPVAGEVVPRLAWEVQNVYGTLNTCDERAAELSARTRVKAKNITLCVLAAFMNENDAPQTAYDILHLIDDPVELVRAKTAMALQLL